MIAALLEPALNSPAQSRFLVKEAVQKLLASGFGGVRIEDDVLVTAGGAKSFTDGLVPRSVKDVEAVMAGAPWPPPS
jgi:Xaa-Pro aminopeptidase